MIGLSLGNHLLTPFAAPFFVLFALWEGRSALLARSPDPGAGATGLPRLAVYLYIPIAAELLDAAPYNHPTSCEAVRCLVTGDQFRSQYDACSLSQGPGVLAYACPGCGSTALSGATALVPVLGLAGLAVLVVFAGVRAGLRRRAVRRHLRLGELPPPRPLSPGAVAAARDRHRVGAGGCGAPA